MNEDATDDGWFRGIDPGDDAAAREAIAGGRADEPADWPALAVASGFAADREAYYDRLRAATIATARELASERELADDRQVVHCIRALDDCRRTANELAERVTEWGHSRYDHDETGVDYARQLADREPDDPVEAELVALAETVADLDDRARSLRATVEETMPSVAPNLAAMAGPVLSARLVSAAGGLEQLARSTSGTLQVLGAEDALFAHLRGDAPSPKHGLIFTHEYVRGTRQEERGSAARALAGKLTIAARVDHYGGDRRPELDEELDERIATIRARDGGDQ